MEQRAAFRRARGFLNFKPASQLLSIFAGGIAALFTLALLLVLGLFADLVVHRGQIPTWQELPRGKREALRPLLLPTDSPRPAADIFETDWQAALRKSLLTNFGPEADERYAEQKHGKPVNLGILSAVYRAEHDAVTVPLIWLARWNPWMWQYGGDGDINAPYLLGLTGAAAVLLLLRWLCLAAMHGFAAATVTEAATRLRRAVYHHTYRLGSLTASAHGASEAVGLFTRDVETVADALYAWLTVFFRRPVELALLLGLALLIDHWLALAFLILAGLVWLLGNALTGSLARRERQAATEVAGQLVLLQESVRLLRLVKGCLMEIFNQGRVEEQLASHTRWSRRRAPLAALARSPQWLLGQLAAVLLLLAAGLQLLGGGLSASAAVVLVAAVACMLGPMLAWRDHLPLLRDGREAAVALFAFLDRPGDIGQAVGAETLPALARRLEFDNVVLREPGGDRLLLQGVSCAIPAGAKVAIVGADEQEKHALVCLIPRFLDPTSGEIRSDDHNLRWVSLESLRKQIGLVLRANLVFSDTVNHNIGCGDNRIKPGQIVEAAKLAHAHQFIQKLPKGYETPIGDLGHALTVAEQFRIALARAILLNPTLFVIEEPPQASLSEDEQYLIDDTLSRVLPGKTALFLAHRLATIRACNQVFLLHKGKIEAKGEHRELIKNNELYQYLMYTEFSAFAR